MARDSDPAGVPPSSLIKATPVLLTGAGAGSVSILAMIPAMGVSASLHVFMIVGFALVLVAGPGKGNESSDSNDSAAVVAADQNDKDKNLDDQVFDLSNPFAGDPNIPSPFPTNDSARLSENTIDGKTRPDEAVGRETGDTSAPRFVVPAPPGMENILGKGSSGGIGIGDLDSMRTMIGGDLGGRSGATKAHLLEKGGGNRESERAVALGLAWLASHQARDGHWAMDDFTNHIEYKDGKEVAATCTCEGGALHDNVAGTGFALLPFLGAGLTPDNGKGDAFDYSKQIQKGLEWLRDNQRPDGQFVDKDPKQQDNAQYSMYNHAIASICMCEAASLYPKAWVKNSAQLALNFLAKVQEPANGGWRYGPTPQAGDTSVVGWCVMALKSGQLAGLKVDSSVFEKAKHFFDLTESETSDGTFYNYMATGNVPVKGIKNVAAGSRTLAAVGLLCRMYMGWKRSEPKLVKGWRWLKTHGMPPDPTGNTDLYYQYYATQVMHHMGGDPDDDAPTSKEFRDGWQEWNKHMRDMLIAKQEQGKGGRPHQQGSWNATGDTHCQIGGRIMMTSLCLLTLEVYYRHLPLYRAAQSDK